MKKETFVISLPTKDKVSTYTGEHTGILLGIDKGALHYKKLTLNEGNGIGYVTHLWEPQHLYICSNEEIKEGDWVITQGGALRQCTNTRSQGNKYICLATDNLVLTTHCKKIIATTNKALTCSGLKRYGESCSKNDNCTYPNCKETVRLIPQSFIQLYIDKYNKGEKIEKCMVEYDDYDKVYGYTTLKLNGNEIIISECEEKLYTREEVKEKFSNEIADRASYTVLPDDIKTKNAIEGDHQFENKAEFEKTASE